jgi:hypothetical protein
VPFLLANTVRDDVSLAGKPARVGLARSLPQRLRAVLSQRGRAERLS